MTDRPLPCAPQVLLKGSVQCTSTKGLDVTLQAGAAFGEGALLTSVRREATVTANEPCHLLQIVAADLEGVAVEWAMLKEHVIAKMLQKVRYFAPLSQSKRLKGAKLLQIEYVPAGGVIFEKGAHGDRFYILAEGRVGIFLARSDQPLGDPVSVKHNHFGDMKGADPYPWFGEASLITGAPRSATAIALEPTKLLTLWSSRFAAFNKEFPTFAAMFGHATTSYTALNRMTRESREAID